MDSLIVRPSRETDLPAIAAIYADAVLNGTASFELEPPSEGAMAEGETAGFRLMVAVIGDAASQASIGLHCALGFREAGVFEGIGFKHGRWLSTVLMQRPLGEGTTSPPVG